MNAEAESKVPTEILEQQAAEERRRIHNSVGELKHSLRETVRERLDVESHARNYIWRIVGAASLAALVMGYGIAGMFTQN